MCVEYESLDDVQIRIKFPKFQPEWSQGNHWPKQMMPLRRGPIIKGTGTVLGQWGMIPPGSKTSVPTKADGQRISTVNARRERMASAWTYQGSWKAGQRCLIPAAAFIEPYWGISGKNTWWRFARADGEPWALAGLWSEWTDPASGEVVPNFTMITQNCDAHPLLRLMHKPEMDKTTKLPLAEQDKRTVVPVERGAWDAWLNGSVEQAAALIQLPPVERFAHGPRDPGRNIELDLVSGEGRELSASGELF